MQAVRTLSIFSLWQVKYSLLYIVIVPLMNMAFHLVPVFSIPFDGKWTPLTTLVGLVLVFRDFSQREIGHYVWIPLLLGVYLSWLLAGPEIALASGLAYLLSEAADWLVYTITKKPLSSRVMLSSMVSAPIDTAVFLFGANQIQPGLFNLATLITMILSKLVAAYVVFVLLRKRNL
jgi:queuosine precursor transporter